MHEYAAIMNQTLSYLLSIDLNDLYYLLTYVLQMTFLNVHVQSKQILKIKISMSIVNKLFHLGR